MFEPAQMKPLTEAVPDLMTTETVMDRADRIYIEKMLMSRKRDRLKIYLHAPFIIPKRDIWALEAAVKKQYFKNKDVRVEIIEHFHLDDMTAQEAYEQYKDSILLELKSIRLYEYNLLRRASLDFSGGETVVLEMPDLSVLAARSGSLSDYLKQVFRERLGFPVNIRLRAGGAAARQAVKDDAEESEILSILDRAIRAEQSEEDRPEKKAPARPFTPKRALLAEEGSWGRDFDGDPIPLSDIRSEMGEVTVRGQILSLEKKPLRNGNTLFSFVLTDFTDSMRGKVFGKPHEEEQLDRVLKEGNFLRVRAVALFDQYDGEVVLSSVSGIKPDQNMKMTRTDTAPLKRVELHAHTQMSEMDGLTHTDEFVKRAAAWGHKAVAITDHGVVQSFPDAMHTADALRQKGKDIRIIYGCEGYLVDDEPGMTAEDIKKAPSYHIILLAKNDTGRINLYRLVSESHLHYFNKRPRIPRSLLAECREGLILGSACEAGELYRALLRDAPEEELQRIVNFYDYLEVQPLGNNAYLTRTGRNGRIYTQDDLRNFVRRILELGRQYAKPVVATCDVHFLDPEDEIYRRILQAGQGYADADFQPPLYFRTTEEMLAEFDFLDYNTAKEIVIDNTNLIADMCEAISPVRPDKCPPQIPGSEEELEKMCYDRAHDMYGERLPVIVEERLSKELTSIIGNGYAVMYIIAQRLVKKSNDDGYLVGSRGSVGSSLVATFSGISEVNPLPPHYRCPQCRHSIFDNEETRRNAGGAGVDMAPMACPVCGAPMIRDGYDIPFETFLGFKGDKEPDIDLNFSGEYQSKAHEYTEVLFGKGCTFKAGTITGLAEKTAFGFVMKYYEEKGEHKRRCEIERIAKGLEGTRRSTGQHPGGIVVMPRGENIYSFTPIQYPANKEKSGIVTTHFDYHSIDHNLLKLDILGHDDPTMIRRLGDLTGLTMTEVPINDEKVLALFNSCEPLGVAPEDLGGCAFGTLGVPEFGTDFAMGILRDANPQSVADLVRIAGIAHGTDVWKGNVQDLIVNKTATLKESICTRDDIMLYLIGQGMDPALSFKIMESVRKGKVAKGKEGSWPAWKKEMEEHGVPEWYLGSAEKIQYMFPKAHAAAYVMMALRVAYCKLYYPLEYYTAYFSIRADGFDYEMMATGRENMTRNLAMLRKNKDSLSDKELLVLRDMRLVEEMYARGIEFMPIDVYKAKADRFQIIDGKIMPSFNSIAGLGLAAAQSLEEAAAQGPFLSREDMIQRSKINSTLAETMAHMGILGDMAESNQLSLTDIVLE
ncbi:MAG: PolC-type DNA polymerase III [Lachnospiraceae bacterium]|nr:PolC-type DNA polymerase III [Lachnospiraceae bacterium]